MCDTCGCGDPGKGFTIQKPGEEESHSHSHRYEHTHDHTHGDQEHRHVHTHEYGHSHEHSGDHPHDHNGNFAHGDHDHTHPHRHVITVQQDILQKNNLLAKRNRDFFNTKRIKVLNLVSSPGSGKTSLLERTIRELGGEIDFFIIEGDQQTMQDAYRIEAAGAPVVQVNTGEGCHLDAEMIHKAVQKLEIRDNAMLMIENVGNLVCPAMFDLGESFRVVITSVTEGEDKPLKYPNMFYSSGTCLINKTDLLPYVDFDRANFREYALRVNPQLFFIELSVKTGEGMEAWYAWLKKVHSEEKGA